MAEVNREVLRDELATVLEAALVGTGKPAQAVYGYRRGDFQGMTAIVSVLSEGSARHNLPREEGNKVYLGLYLFVLYSDGADWNEDDAEDCLDEIEALIAETLAVYRRHPGYWQCIDYADRSTREATLIIGGVPYILEHIPLEATYY